MTPQKPVLLIPVENQVRELDAKLLLACVAARQGLTSIIGPKRDVESRIASFPRSIFLSKSLRVAKRQIFPLPERHPFRVHEVVDSALKVLPRQAQDLGRLAHQIDAALDTAHIALVGEIPLHTAEVRGTDAPSPPPPRLLSAPAPRHQKPSMTGVSIYIFLKLG